MKYSSLFVKIWKKLCLTYNKISVIIHFCKRTFFDIFKRFLTHCDRNGCMKKITVISFFIFLLTAVLLNVSPVYATEAQESATGDLTVDAAATTTPQTFTAGWFRKDGDYYYRNSDGSILEKSGIVTIDKYKYILGKKGKRLSGFNKVKGKWYYCNPKNGRLTVEVGWKKIKGSKYYIGKGGVLATGVKKIGKTKYGFTSEGKLRISSKPYKFKGKYYRTNKKGVVEKLSNIQVSCSNATRKYIDRYTSSKTSNKKKLKVLFHTLISGNYVTGYIDRKEIEPKDFQYRVAYKVLSNNGKYNCYGFACTFASIAKELGYEPYVIVMDDDHAVVMIDGKYYDNMGARFGTKTPALAGYKTYKKVKF